jgi:thiamine pyrophosphokinase
MIIKLPQATIKHPALPQLAELLLIAGGRSPSPQWLRTAAKNRSVWCIDHGIDACRTAGLMPSRLIGDGDSAATGSWHWAESLNIPIERFSPEKDLTDTQLALHRIKASQPGAYILLTGAFGGRFDHAVSTVYSLLGSGMAGCIADEQEALFYLHGGETITIRFHCRPKAISLLPLGADCQNVSIQGVHWPLSQAYLSQTWPYAISNEPASPDQPFTVSLSQGCLGVYLCWEEV